MDAHRAFYKETVHHLSLPSLFINIPCSDFVFLFMRPTAAFSEVYFSYFESKRKYYICLQSEILYNKKKVLDNIIY